ncbi:AMP-binding protein [Clostridium kluyveri]|uniref:Carrier domain-containing protein n=1 Tax=Clostridium kluyveri TaxID=1534 RepID=A0A1L5F7E9_CLOKL|nr:AMP-binding protein [Clostridium kluyveri]APM38907.1 hypothetical protein BS101_09160 [Clostridium kluyveri]
MDSYVRSEKLEIKNFPKELSTLLKIAGDFSRINGRGIYFIEEDESEIFLPYYKLYENAVRLCSGLQKLGVKRGDKLIFQLKSEFNFINMFWACIVGGYIPVPLPISNIYSYNSQDLVRFLNVTEQLSHPKIISEKLFQEFFNEGAYSNLTVIYFEDIDKSYEQNNKIQLPLPSDIAFIQFSSGSTGNPKGVILTHNNLIHNIFQINEKSKSTNMDFMANWMPLTHNLGLIALHIAPLGAFSNQIKFNTELFIKKPELFMKKITIYKATMSGFPNFALSLLLERIPDDESQNYDLSHLRLIYNGAEPISNNVIQKFNKKFSKWYLNKKAMHATYGMAEASVIISLQDMDDSIISHKIIRNEFSLNNNIIYSEDNEDTIEFVDVGYLLPEMEVKVLDDDDILLENEKVGNILVKGPNITSGYINDDGMNEKLFLDGFLRTGDLGFVKDGRLVITGRRRDLIFFNGQNFYAHDIEHLCEEIDEVDFGQVAACGVTNYKNGSEELIIFIQFREEIKNFSEATLRIKEYVNRRIGQSITHILPVEYIPKTASGKIQRQELGQRYLNGEFHDIILMINEEIKNCNNKNNTARNKIDFDLIKLWGRILNLENIRIQDDFFKLGGDSLKLIQICYEISNIYKVDINSSEFIKLGNILNISDYIQNNKNLISEQKYPVSAPDTKNLNVPFPLSEVQSAYFTGRNSGFEMGGVSTHIYYEIETKLDIDKFNQSLNKVIKHQPMLRAIILESGQQKILESVPKYNIKVEDISELNYDSQQERILEERDRMSHYIFKTDIWPLFEFKAFKTNINKYYMLIGFDLLISDGTSMRILVKEIIENYDCFHKGYQKLKFNFRDYVTACEEFKISKVYENDKKYWMEKLKDFPQAPKLPLKQEPSEVASPHFKRQNKIISKNIWENIKKKAKENNITPSVLLCTAYAQILGHWSNEPHHAINVTVFTRYPFHEDVNKIIGDFTSVMLLDVDLKTGTSFWEKASEVQSSMMEALEHRHYDGINFIRDISKYNGLGAKAVMPIVFTSLLFSMDNEEKGVGFTELGDIKMGVSQTSQVYLDYQVMEIGGNLSITWDYVEELFEEDMINTMFQQYVKLVESLLEHREYRLQAEEETIKFIDNYNHREEFIPETTLQELFMKKAKECPENTALIFEDRSMNYRELDIKSNQVAHYLKQQGFGSSDFIGIGSVKSL